MRLTVNVNRAEIREMIRRGFFVMGVWLDELETLESVAKDIISERDSTGRPVLETDPEFWGRAKQIVELGARIPAQERRSDPQSKSKQPAKAHQKRRSHQQNTA
ncbi:MAG: hypothetical protein JO307_26150 [Bryobacterales bacterium]|nr:hypothetical protein [Bryobacterales bacterium]